MLGRGSNLLVRDGGVRGAVVCLAQPYFSRIEVVDESIRCGAGARLRAVAAEAVIPNSVTSRRNSRRLILPWLISLCKSPMAG